jgi:hypothetical protein
MKVLLLVLAIVGFVVAAIVALAGGSWDTFDHVVGIVAIALALFAGHHLPVSNG